GLATAIFTLAFNAEAASLSVDPLRLELEPNVRATAITVRNDESRPVVIQARVMAWSQPAGKDQLDETREFLVTPAVVEIPAKGFQVLRIGRRAAAKPGTTEQSFRVLIKEVLSEQGASVGGIRMAMEFSLPIFVDAPTLAPARLSWTAERGLDAVLLTANNSGARRARVSSAELLDADGRSIGHWHGVTYLLAGATRSFRFRADALITDGSPVTLVFTTEAGVEEVHATVVQAGS
ncbi:MAG: fimbrial biogenesis chaperone, partial [Dongiaceae bacterium]